jgi:lysophospholipase L1-like esterase
MAIAEQQLATGRRVVLMTCMPYNNFTATTYAMSQIQNQRVKSSGLPFIDWSPLYGTLGSYANPLWQVGDNVHPSGLGNEVMAPFWQAVLDPMIS